ncbi:MAG: hypothetical protein JOZ69_11225 [Myxococcales bacterium]|nr:hypothetical protein [Myxococcales bacterium]
MARREGDAATPPRPQEARVAHARRRRSGSGARRGGLGRPAGGRGGRALLFAARPLGEPVARSGPFVMNTEDELRRAWEDYRRGVLASAG